MTEGSAVPKEPLSNAATRLQGDLRRFATDFGWNARLGTVSGLYDAVSAIKMQVTKAVVAELTDPHRNPDLADRDYCPHFRAAAHATPTRSFFTDGDRSVNPWEGGYTVVLLEGQGRLLAAESNPVGRVYEEYGADLFPYAMQKALLALHLDQTGRDRGLDSEDNLDYLERQGFWGGRDLFMGEATVPVFGVEQFHIGASGCGLRQDYIDNLLPISMRGKAPVNFVAARADQEFARVLAGRYGLGNYDELYMSEPDFFAQLRRAH